MLSFSWSYQYSHWRQFSKELISNIDETVNGYIYLYTANVILYILEYLQHIPYILFHSLTKYHWKHCCKQRASLSSHSVQELSLQMKLRLLSQKLHRQFNASMNSTVIVHDHIHCSLWTQFSHVCIYTIRLVHSQTTFIFIFSDCIGFK